MRKIEKDMLAAINGGRDWKQANTEVRCERGRFRDYFADVFLHGNHIAEVYENMSGERRVAVNKATLCEHPTQTTMSRLRALGVDVCTRKGKVILNGQELEASR